ncbi:RAB proteins geranylgeranyltransferase [Zymobacter palmae]|uniref:RAB proteins geranylgeranyltransferase n=1 Tax=Zymobacter palmae TaxID=33074 RepID=A0A348HF24_9GAMM|nr:RAB proteins geranylgeranyltransferase [Zymobacter palmae]
MLFGTGGFREERCGLSGRQHFFHPSRHSVTVHVDADVNDTTLCPAVIKVVAVGGCHQGQAFRRPFGDNVDMAFGSLEQFRFQHPCYGTAVMRAAAVDAQCAFVEVRVEIEAMLQHFAQFALMAGDALHACRIKNGLVGDVQTYQCHWPCRAQHAFCCMRVGEDVSFGGWCNVTAGMNGTAHYDNSFDAIDDGRVELQCGSQIAQRTYGDEGDFPRTFTCLIDDKLRCTYGFRFARRVGQRLVAQPVGAVDPRRRRERCLDQWVSGTLCYRNVLACQLGQQQCITRCCFDIHITECRGQTDQFDFRRSHQQGNCLGVIDARIGVEDDRDRHAQFSIQTETRRAARKLRAIIM